MQSKLCIELSTTCKGTALSLLYLSYLLPRNGLNVLVFKLLLEDWTFNYYLPLQGDMKKDLVDKK